MSKFTRQALFLFIVFTLFSATTLHVVAQEINAFYDDVETFLNAYVSDGLVDYQKVKSEPAQLDALLQQIAAMDRASLSAADDKAFLINTYNVLVIKNVVDHYPIGSPLEVNGFFDRDKFEVAGEMQTLDGVEKGDLYVKYPDARLHFVLVCAAIGCPKLITEAYRSTSLDELLDRQTSRSLNDPFYAKLEADGKKINVTELFSWYKDDFTRGGISVIDFINKYRTEQLPADTKIGFIKYDWQLNDYKKKVLTGDNAPNGPDQRTLLPGENLQAFTPSTLLVRGQIDLKVFNNLYTQTSFFDHTGSRVETNRRDTYFTSIISIGVGVSTRINLGLDLYPKAVRVGAERSSPFSVLQFSTNNDARATLAAIAPKIKFNPFKKAPTLAAQVSVYLPLASDLEGQQSGRPFLDYDDTQFWVQAFYDLPLGPFWLLYLEGGFFFRYDSAEENVNHEYIYPVKGILNYYATNRLTVYGVAELTPSALYQDASLFSTLYTQLGAGLKYQLTPRFEIETLATVFPVGYNKGAGQTLNFGFRYVR